MHEILKLDLFKRNFARRLFTVWGAHTQKIRTRIEILDRKISRFRPGTVGGHISTSRLLSLLLPTVGLSLFAFASAGGRDDLSIDGLIVFVRCLAATVCQTAQGNMIWAGVSRCLIDDISNSQVLILHASWIYLSNILHMISHIECLL